MYVLDDEQDRPLAGQRITGRRPADGVGYGLPQPLHQAALAGAGGSFYQQQQGPAGPLLVECGAEPFAQRGLGCVRGLSGVGHDSPP